MDWVNSIKNKFNRKDNRSKAFTLIEVIIVIAIIGVLIMLGVPKFKGYVEDAKLTQIKGDIRTVESVLLADRTDKTVSDKDVDDNLTDRTLDKDKLILKDSESLTGNEVTNKEDFKQIKEDFIKDNTTIKKDLDRFYFNKSTNEVGFLYEGKGSNSNIGEDIDKPTDHNKDKTYQDFEFVEDEDGYKVEGRGTGYFHYIGNEKIVEIPHIIQDHPMDSYYKMFKGADVEEVISTNKNISDMSYMFIESTSEKLHVYKLNTSNTTNMSSMFKDSSATILNLYSFDTSKVTNMSHMFCGSKATELYLYSFDTSNVTDMSYMFQDTKGLTEIDLSSFIIKNELDMNDIFKDSNATKGYARTQETAKILNKTSNKPTDLLFKAKWLATDDDFEFVEPWGGYGYEVNGKKGYFKYIGGKEIVEIPYVIQGHEMTSYYKMFSEIGANKVISTNKKITDMSFMFYENSVLDLSEFDTSNVRTMEGMFWGSRTNKINLSSFDTSKVENMRGMFRESAAKIIFGDNFNTENVTTMEYMFQDFSIWELDLSSFKTSDNINMTDMFKYTNVAVGWAKTDEDAKRFNNESITDIPYNLEFKVKPKDK